MSSVFISTGKYLRQALKFNGPLLSVVFTLAGAYTSYSLFRSLAVSNESRVEEKTRDTMFVKLLDMPGVLNQTNSPGKEVGLADVDSQYNNEKFAGDTSPVVDVGDEESVRKVTGIADSDVENVFKKHREGSNSISTLSALSLATILVLLWAGRKVLPYLSEDTVLDKDPEELTRVFKTYSQQIELLGNPRKIKRLSNKIRFQYQFLHIKGLIDQNSARSLVEILLFLENRGILSPAGAETLKIAMANKPQFINYFGPLLKGKGLPGDQDALMGYLFALNRDSFI